MLSPTNYYNLKKYRGFLLAQITTLINNQSNPCTSCHHQENFNKTYAELQRQFTEVDHLIKRNKMALKKRHHLNDAALYLCSFPDVSKPCLVNATNKYVAGAYFIQCFSAQYANISVCFITHSKAKQLVSHTNIETIQAYHRFLEQCEFYTGLIIKLPLPAALVRQWI